MEDTPKKTGSNLGIAALITAIITFVIAVIPCVGLIAIIPGIIAIILASVGLSQSSGSTAPKGVLVAGLVIGIIAFLISTSQIYVATKLAHHAGKWPGDIENIVKDVQDNVIKDMNDENISIKVEKDGTKVEITTGEDKKEKEQKLEELEGVKTEKKDSLATQKGTTPKK